MVHRSSVLLILALAPGVAPAPAAAPRPPASAASSADEGDEQYQFLAGLCDKGLWELAIKEGRAFLERFGRHPRADLARYRLATALFELERGEEAEREYDALAPRSGFEYAAEAAFRQGQCALARGDATKAASAFERTLSAGKDYLSRPATFYLGEALFALQRFEEAGRRYAEVLAADPRGEYARASEYGLLWCAFRSGRHDEVLQRSQAFERAHAGEDDAAEILSEVSFLRGEALLATGEPRKALQAYQAAGGGVHAESAARGAAFALSALSEHAAAAQAFEELLARFPEGRHAPEAALQAGVERLRAGDARAARALLEDPRVERTNEALYWLALAQSQSGDASSALATIEQSLAGRPERELAQRLEVARGDALRDLGRGEEAGAAYQRAGNEYGLYAAAVSALNGGRSEEAARLAGRLIGEFPGSAYRNDALQVVGEALLAQDQPQVARRAFEMLIAAGPEEPVLVRASSRAAWCRFLAGEHAQAAADFGELARRFPESPEAEEALYMAGRASEATGDSAAAIEDWRGWLSRYPRGARRPEVLLGLARLDQGEQGRRWLAQAVDEAPAGPLAEEALLRLGERLAAEERHEEAARAYARVLESGGNAEFCRSARYGLAWCLYQQGDHAQAEQALAPLVADREASEDLRLYARELSVWTAAGRADPRACASAWQALAEVCTDDARSLAALKVALSACRKAKDPQSGQALLEAFLDRVRDRGAAAEALVEGVWLALDAQQVDAAEAALRSALRITPEEAGAGEKRQALAEAAFFVGEARYAAGDEAGAAGLYQLAAADARGELAARVAYKRGFAALKQNDLSTAEQAFAHLVEHDGGSELAAQGLHLLGEARFRRGDWRAAIEPLKRLTKEAPRYEAMPQALFRLGLAQGQLQAWRECETALSELLRREPEFEQRAEAQLWRGRALAARKDARGARSAFESAVAGDRGAIGAQARLEIGHLARAAGDLESALSEYLKVGVLYADEPSVAEGLLLAGECLEEQGDASAARARYREVIEQYPEQQAAARAKGRLSALSSR